MKTVFFYVLFLLGTSMMMGCIGNKSTVEQNPKGSSFSPQELSLFTNGSNTTPMRVYKIYDHSDSILLRTKSIDVKVDPNDPNLKLFVDRLYATVRDSMSLGAGIAAPQVGILKNIIWVQRFDKEDFPFEVFLNPKIVQYSEKKQTRKEGCLSIPGRSETLSSRAYAILVEYDTMDNEHLYEMVEDFTAIIFQHEVDHLNGILYLDHLEEEMAASKKD